MATPGRSVDLAIEQRQLREMLEHEPFRVQFFQAVRLMERLDPKGEAVGRFTHPAREVVRFTARPSMSFPASEVHSTDWPAGKPPRMMVNFMGLTGPLGALPLYYTELVMQRNQARNYSVRDFLDIFNHRMVALFYRAWEKYRFTVAYERGERDQLASMLMNLIGLGTPGLEARQDIGDESLLFYSGLLAQRPRSAGGLEQVIGDHFDVPVEIDQFAGAWYKLDKPTQTRLAEANTQGECLGFGVVLGDEIWDRQSCARIRIGPLPLERYLDFLPTGSAYAPLRSLVRFYFNDQLDFQLQLVLKRADTPGCELGAEGDAAPKLGWVTWVKTRGLGRDPGDTVTRL